MIKIVFNNFLFIDNFLLSCQRAHLDFQEYAFLKDDELKMQLKNKTVRIMNQVDSFSLIALSQSRPVGLLNIVKDHFDSEIFGLDCYRISDLIIIPDDLLEVNIIADNLLLEIEKILKKINKHFYLFISLNNNISNSGFLFNNFVNNKFYYIHTLLTFCSFGRKNQFGDQNSNQRFLIREAQISDAAGISKLAQKSFKFSRFHMDPYLDNEKANILLKTSAENSVLNHYVDIMFVVEYENKVIGYYSAKKRFISEFNKTFGEATISAVDTAYRGLGVFSTLNSHLLNWFSNNTDFAEMGTYLANSPVHKTWINCNLQLIRGNHQFSKIYK